MNKERVKYVIELLGSIKPESWNYGTWAVDFDWDEVDMQGVPHCGTAACAAGWMGLNSKIRAEGFYVDSGGAPRFGSEVGTVAVADYLGITYKDSTRIFMNLEDDLTEDGVDLEHGDVPNTYGVTPQHVARALQELLDRA